MSEREYVLSLMVRSARRRATHHGITDVDVLIAFLADDAAIGHEGGCGPASETTPRFHYQTHRRGVWLGDWSHRDAGNGTPDLTWREVAEAALGVVRPQQMALFA